MEGALSCCNRDHPALLKQVAGDTGPFNMIVLSKKYLHVLAKPARVVVPDCLAVAERLQQRVAGQDLVLY